MALINLYEDEVLPGAVLDLRNEGRLFLVFNQGAGHVHDLKAFIPNPGNTDRVRLLLNELRERSEESLLTEFSVLQNRPLSGDLDLNLDA